jgi:hypothetical protein
MIDDTNQTKKKPAVFDFSAFPPNSVFYERRLGKERRDFEPIDVPQVVIPEPASPAERRAKKERRKRIDPTTFEKQYTDDELQFMNAMQKFKERSGKPFPTYGEVIKVAVSLGYRRVIFDGPAQAPEPAEDSVHGAPANFDEGLFGAAQQSGHPVS